MPRRKDAREREEEDCVEKDFWQAAKAKRPQEAIVQLLLTLPACGQPQTYATRVQPFTVVAVAGAFKASSFCFTSPARPLISGSLVVLTTFSNDLLTALATP
jgi:hypothetical protein